MYRFLEHASGIPWALVVRPASVPKAVRDVGPWTPGIERPDSATNADVRRLVEVQGYCLIEHNCPRADLNRAEAEAGIASGRATAPSTALPETVAPAPGDVLFFRHRDVPAFRAAVRSDEREALPGGEVRWDFARARSGSDTAPAVTAEIAARRYALFRIDGTVEQLTKRLQERVREGRGQ